MLIRLLVLLLISTCLLALATQRKPAPFAPDLHTEILWGAPAPTYLSGVRDDYCHAGAHSHWSDAISSDRLAEALRSDSRTDVGQTIRELIVSRRDKTGKGRTPFDHRQPETSDKRLGIQADRGPRARLERFEKLAFHDLTFRLDVCISRQRLRPRSRFMSGKFCERPGVVADRTRTQAHNRKVRR
jgi:hypothetical protein